MSSTLSHIGKYELRAVLARTATSIVYDGWDANIARRVAVKAIPLSRLEDDDTREALARFKRGVQAAGQLAHPNILNIYDYGETGEYAYIVMEFVDGPTLKQLLDSGERFDAGSICKIMDGILDGLQYSHDRGVVHRDMKPANIMFTKDHRVKITDFGIARLEDSNMTQTGMVIGTPAYMSPEQFMGEKVDWRSDIYSTGVVLYHMITGTRPYDGNLATIMNKVLNSPIPKPSIISPTASPALDQIVMRAMAKKREQRFQSAAEFNAALKAVIAPPEPLYRPVKTPQKEGLSPPRSTPRRKFRPHPAFVGGIAMILLATGFGVAWYWHRPSSVTQMPAPAPEVHKAPPAPLPTFAEAPPQQPPEPPRSRVEPLPTQSYGSGNQAAPSMEPQPTNRDTLAQTSAGTADDNSQSSDEDLGAALPPIAPRQVEPPPASPQFRTPATIPLQPPRRVELPPPRKNVEVPGKTTASPNLPGSAAVKPESGLKFGSQEQGNAVPGRTLPDGSSLQEALNRLTLGTQSSRPGAPAPDRTLQPPPAYPTTSVSAVGLVCQSVTADTAQQLGLDAPRGMWCTGVTAGSAAALAGIRSNDVLLSIGGTEMRDLSGLRKIAAGTSAGHTVPVEIFRNGSRRTVQLALDPLR